MFVSSMSANLGRGGMATVHREQARPGRHGHVYKPGGDDISLTPEFLFFGTGNSHPHLPAAQARALMTRPIPRPGPSAEWGEGEYLCPNL